MKPNLTKHSSKKIVVSNPKPKAGVTYGAKPGLHEAGKKGMKAPKGKGTLVD